MYNIYRNDSYHNPTEAFVAHSRNFQKSRGEGRCHRSVDALLVRRSLLRRQVRKEGVDLTPIIIPKAREERMRSGYVVFVHNGIEILLTRETAHAGMVS